MYNDKLFRYLVSETSRTHAKNLNSRYATYLYERGIKIIFLISLRPQAHRFVDKDNDEHDVLSMYQYEDRLIRAKPANPTIL